MRPFTTPIIGDVGRTRHPAVVVAVLATTGTCMSLMQTLVIPLIPELPTLLHTSASNASWVITATLLVAATSLLTVNREPTTDLAKAELVRMQPVAEPMAALATPTPAPAAPAQDSSRVAAPRSTASVQTRPPVLPPPAAAEKTADAQEKNRAERLLDGARRED